MDNSLSNIPTSRLEALTDGIFAVAMTILVLSIEIPSPASSGIADIDLYVISLIPQISIYFISFILLGCFWITHHSFFLIERSNLTLIWINILWLMAICLVPLSVSLVANYGNYVISDIFFGFNIFTIGLLYLIDIYYAHKKGFFKKHLNFDINLFFSFPIAIMLLSVLDISISLINPTYTKFFYLLIPLFAISWKFFYRIKFFKN